MQAKPNEGLPMRARLDGRCMHPTSLKLQQLYTRFTAAEIGDLLREAMEQTSSESSVNARSEKD